MSRPPKGVTAAQRFLALVDTSNGAESCWEWQGYRQHLGYGRFRVNGFKTLAHRFSYEHFVGPIPEGLSLDHLCRNPACVNPAHLEPVTHRENVLRGEAPAARNATKTQCPHGHPYSTENTYIDYLGRRVCKTCRTEWQRTYQQRVRARSGGAGCAGTAGL